MMNQGPGFYSVPEQHQHLQQTPRDYSTSDAGQRQRTSSSPQRPAPLTYNDTFHQQHYPGMSYAAASRGNLPPGAMAPAPLAPPQGNGFHPYRRQQPRQGGGDASSVSSATSGLNSSSSSSTTVGPHASPAPGAPQLVPPQPSRARSSSTNSNETTPRREGAPSVSGAPPVSFSAAAASSLQSQSPNSVPTARSPGMQQQQSTTTPSTAAGPTTKRPEPPKHSESTRSTSSAVGQGSDGSLPHSRSDSISSQSSVYSTAASDKASTVGRSASAINAKKPSPLSRQPAAEDEDDDDTNADYGGSDGEEPSTGRQTPTLGSEKKKGLSGKLRKALSLSTMNEIQQQQQSSADPAAKSRPLAAPAGRTLSSTHSSTTSRTHTAGQDSISGSMRGTPRSFADGSVTTDNSSVLGSSAASISSKRSARPPLSGSAGDGSGKRSLFNRKFNSSTDNISISSTVSSASVMLRKVGNLGKLARRHSLMGLTNMFNKDKEGRDGLHDDDFGAVPGAPASAADDSAVGGKSKKGKKGKGTPALASVSHATVEQDTGSDGNMTPAAHYVRQHQLQMRQQAEQEAQAARERQDAEAARVASMKSKGGKTTDDVVESRQKMIEKEKERLKSKRGWRNKLRVGGGSSVDHSIPSNNGLETVPYDTNANDANDGTAVSQGIYTGGAGSMRHAHQQQHGADGYDGQMLQEEEELVPPHMPAAGGRQYGSGAEDSGDEFETDSLRHWGEGIERSRASAALVQAPKSILKKSASHSQLDQMVGGGHGQTGGSNNGIDGRGIERPFAGRIRANSYDAPQAGPQAGAPMLSAMSTTQDGADKMDGVGRAPSPSGQNQQQQSSAQRPSPPTQAPLGHHANSSMPTLSLMTNPTTGTVPRPSLQRKRIVFTEEHIYHSTWPAHVYDRRGELATCNRLTAELAQQIKEELNSYKMEEMVVAPSSRIYTHFFV